MKRTGFITVFPALAAILIAGLALTGCGERKNRGGGQGTDLSQQSDAYPDSGYFVCRHDFRYAYDSTGKKEVGDFVAVAGQGRKAQKRAILAKCTTRTSGSGSLPVEGARACADAEAMKSIRCVHEDLPIPSFDPRRSAECSLKYKPIFEGRPLDDLETEITSVGARGGVQKHVRSVIENCLKEVGADLDGCTDALMKGQITCVSR